MSKSARVFLNVYIATTNPLWKPHRIGLKAKFSGLNYRRIKTVNNYNNWCEEKRSAYLYQIMAQYEKNILHQKLFSKLALAAEKQATLWENKIKKQHPPMTFIYHPDLRTRLVASLVKYLGTENIHFILSAMKMRGMSVFTQIHSERRHTTLNTASNLRAAIFGINDGLVSNMSLILGISSAGVSSHYMILTGVAGLLAGACSMAAGEYISVRSQRDMFEYQIALEKQELEEYPEEEIEELNLIYQARGIPIDSAEKLATLMVNNPETGLNTLAREELGIHPDDLVSPIGAMLSSFVAFAIGALVPLLPFLFYESAWNLLASIMVTALALFMTGAILSLFINRHPLLLGLRMLFIGAIAGSITYVIGRWIGMRLI